MEEIHIEYGMPNVDVAMPLLTERLRSLKKSGVKAVKIIHGYGSTGKGGRLRKATIKLLEESKTNGLIREFVVGEQWSKCAMNMAKRRPRLPGKAGRSLCCEGLEEVKGLKSSLSSSKRPSCSTLSI